MKNFNTLVIQPHRSPLPFPWIEHCLESMPQWCTLNQFHEHSPQAIAAANICISNCEKGDIKHQEIMQLIDVLLTRKKI